MQKSIKKLLAVVLSVLLVTSTMLVAFAAVGVNSLTVDGTTVIRNSSVRTTSGNGWTYDAETNTLTLTNADISNITASSNNMRNPELTIKLVGSSMVETISPDDMELYILTDEENAYITCTEEFDFTAAGNVTIGEGVTFVNSVYLRLEQGETLTNNGTLINIGTIDIRDNRTTIVNNGTIINKGQITNPNRVTGDGTITTEGDTSVPCGHTYDSWSTRVNATCIATGLKAYAQCTKCSKYYDNEGNEVSGPDDAALVIPMTAHTLGEWIDEVEPENCEDTGTVGHYTCSVCGKYFAADKTTEITDITTGGGAHTAGAAVIENEVANSCTQPGSYDTVVYCTVCGDELSRETTTVPAAGHTAGAVATCTTAQTCTVCGAVIEAALGHTDGEAVIENNVDPTCTEEGSYDTVVYCTVCGDELSRVETIVDALGHTDGEAVIENEVANSCEGTGSYDTVTYCTVCGAETSRETTTVDAAGHTAGEAVVENNVDPTCTVEGSYDTVVYCTVCNSELSRVETIVDALGHKDGEAVIENEVANSCEGTGSYDTVTYCTVCGAETSRETTTVDAAGHTAGEAVVENNVAPTCTVEGSYDTVVYCTVCNSELSRVETIVDALGHKDGEAVIENEVANSCEGTGSYDTVTYCTVCGDETSRIITTVDAAGHTAGEAVVENNVDPTCTVEGSYDTVVYCTVCNSELSRVETIVDALGHTTVVDAAVAPTCTETGLTEGSHCSVCGETLVAQEIVAALGHTVAIDAAVAPTCTETGLTEGSHCSVCGEVLVAQVVIPANGHSYVAVVTDPTCTEEGYTTYTCSVCDDTYVDDKVAALGHEVVIDEAVEPTCMKEGLKEGSHCGVCGEILKAQKSIAKIDHSFTKYVYDEGSATCTANGTKTAQCDFGCGTTKTKTASGTKLAHVDNDGDGCCDECGSTAIGYCEVCGGPQHEDFISNVFCILTAFFRLVASFIREVL